MAGQGPKYPDVLVQMTGQDGNVFFIIGRVSKALREAGHVDQVQAFVNEVTDTDSYDAALAVVQQWVSVG